MRKLLLVLGCVCAVFAAGAFDVVTLQQQIDAASARGGGKVVVPAGTWTSNPLRLKSNVTLHLAEGAVLKATHDIPSYRNVQPRFQAFIEAFGQDNVALEGAGVIDGQGSFFPTAGWRPKLVQFSNCRNVRVEDVSLRASGAWTMFCERCDGVVYRGVKLFSHVNHCTDGLDVSSRNVLIENCDIDADDDALVFKTLAPDVAIENVTVRNCRFASSCNAIKFGTESHGLIRNVSISDITIAPPRTQGRYDWRTRIPGAVDYETGLAGLAIECVDGETLEDVTIRNVRMTGMQTPIFIRLGRRHAAREDRLACLRNVLIENVMAKAASRIACSITGVPGLRPANITLRNVKLAFPGGGDASDTLIPVPEVEDHYPENFMFNGLALPAYGFYVRHADGVRFEGVTTRLLAADRRPAVVIDDANVTISDTCKLAPSESRLPNVYRVDPTAARAAEDAFWKSVTRDFGHFVLPPVSAGQGKPALLVYLGVRKEARPADVVGECRRRGWAMLTPFATDVAGVLKAVDRVADQVDASRVLLKGDGHMASRALELLAAAPTRWAAVAAVNPAKPVSGLDSARGAAVDIVTPAKNPEKVRAGLAAFNQLAEPADRLDTATVETIVRTGSVPAALRYTGRDPGFQPPGRPLVLRRQSGEVRLSVTDNAEVGCFIPSFDWLGAGRTGRTAKRRLIFAGDSTLQRTPPNGKNGSWGEALRPYLAEDVEIVNCAIGGRSTRTYMDDWKTNTVNKIRPGDWVMIQFGHNDSSKSSDPTLDRMTDPDDEYINNLRRYVADVKLKGGRPLLVTSITLYLWKKDGSWREANPLGPWVAAMKRLAADYEIPIVDLNAATLAAEKAAGQAGSVKWFMYSVDGKDWAHPTRLGAETIARLFKDAALQVGGPVTELFRPDVASETVALALSADGQVLQAVQATVSDVETDKDAFGNAILRFRFQPARPEKPVRLRVAGLHPRNWYVNVNGWTVGKWLDEELDRGILLGVQKGGQVEVSKKQHAKPNDWVKWEPLYREVRSSLDGSLQPCYFWAPDKAKTEAVPLVVGLHTWSGSWRDAGHYAPALAYAQQHGWAMVGPNFRGSNDTPKGCGSDLAVQDIVDAVNFAKAQVKIDANRVYIVGGSGGGHMTLLMAGRHPELWAGCAAFCPISDLARWHADSRLDHPGRGKHYAQMLEKACGGTPAEKPQEYAARSPLTWLKRARAAQVPVYIVTGIHDGWTGSVPVGHSFRAFNALADAKDAVSEADIASVEETQQVPAELSYVGESDPFYGEKMKIHFRRTSANVRFTLFEGGHGGNFAAGLDFLARQVKGRPADMTLPKTATGAEIELGR